MRLNVNELKNTYKKIIKDKRALHRLQEQGYVFILIYLKFL